MIKYLFIRKGAILMLLLMSRFIIAQTAGLQRFAYEEPKMGTIFRIVLYAPDAATADSAAAAAFRHIDALNLIFSDYREDSEVSRLSDVAGSGQKITVSPELWEVLVFSKKLSKKSKGAFDVSIGPLSKLWRRAFRQQEFPKMTGIAEAKALVDHRQIKLYRKHRRVQLRRTGMRLDFGGIAKGFTVDEVYQVLRSFGIDRALVDGGGDIYAGKAPPGAEGWEIELFSGSVQKLLLADRAIASSGSTYKYLDWNGKRYSHIIDPRTGFGVTETSIINVSAHNCMQADAFASALSVLNPEESSKLLRDFPDVRFLDGARNPLPGARQ